jgi:hypothetical protein
MERNDVCPSLDQHGHASPYGMCFHSLSNCGTASVAVITIVGLKGVVISLLLAGVIKVPSLQTNSVFIIDKFIRNLQHGGPHFWVNALNFESSPPLGANIFVLESIEQKCETLPSKALPHTLTRLGVGLAWVRRNRENRM